MMIPETIKKILPFLVIFAGIVPLALRQAWNNILEGQIGKQNFVAHMIESYLTGAIESGFPLRFFFEPWHPGVIPWAEEFPLYHLFAVGIDRITGLGAVQSGRILNLISVLAMIHFTRRICVRALAIPRKTALFVSGLFILLPGIQIYGSSVIPDTPMLAALIAALCYRIEGRKNTAYLWLGLACAFKYFAVFSVLAFWIFDNIETFRSKGSKTDYLRSFIAAAISVSPTVLYLGYFIHARIPNPVTEYMANGYGHLAGPFLFRLKFYIRFFTWVFIKNPGLPFGVLSVFGCILAFRDKATSNEFERLKSFMGIWFLCLVLFAMVFASSFFVHDYYALPFLIPVAFFGFYGISRIPSPPVRVMVVLVMVILGIVQSSRALRRQMHYLPAAKIVRREFSSIPDRDKDRLLIFITNFSQPPIPVLSRKSGWSFVIDHYADQSRYLKERLSDPRVEGIVLHYGPTSGNPHEQWQKDIMEFGFQPTRSEKIMDNTVIIFRSHGFNEMDRRDGAKPPQNE